MAEGLAAKRVRIGRWVLVCLTPFAACSWETPTAAPAPAKAVLPPLAASPAPPAADSDAPVFAVKGILAPDRRMRPGDYAWTEDGAPAGEMTIIIDLKWQRLYVYRAGVEIGRSSIIYGADNKPTPTGTFPILEKDIDHVSNLYDAEMPYMLRLTWDGIAVHGAAVDEWSATNGCIGVPDEFAALLFAQARLGDTVLVTSDWLRDTYGSHS